MILTIWTIANIIIILSRYPCFYYIISVTTTFVVIMNINIIILAILIIIKYDAKYVSIFFLLCVF